MARSSPILGLFVQLRSTPPAGPNPNPPDHPHHPHHPPRAPVAGEENTIPLDFVHLTRLPLTRLLANANANATGGGYHHPTTRLPAYQTKPNPWTRTLMSDDLVPVHWHHPRPIGIGTRRIMIISGDCGNERGGGWRRGGAGRGGDVSGGDRGGHKGVMEGGIEGDKERGG